MVDRIANVISTVFVSVFSWILRLIGIVASPIVQLVTASPLVFLGVLLAVVCFSFYLVGAKELTKIDGDTVAYEMKINLPFLHASFLLGYFATMTGNSDFYDTMLWYKGITEFPMLFTNYEQWAFYAKLVFVIMVLGIPILGFVYGRAMGVWGLVRELILMINACMVGSVLSAIRVLLLTMSNFYFLRVIIGAVWSYAEGFSLAMILGYIAAQFLVPSSGALSSRSTSNYSGGGFSSSDTSTLSHSGPVYVTDEWGNSYPVEIRGDFLYIRKPNGEISTKWEYVQDKNYFYLEGTRYHLH